MRLLDLFARRPRPADSTQALQSWFVARGRSPYAAPIADLLADMLDFYAGQRFAGLEPEEADGDMLLFSYGCYDWGEGEHFDMKLTRQFVAARGDNPLSQLHLNFLYPPEPDLRALGAFEAWCPTRADLPGFRAQVLESPAVALAGARPAVHREVYWGLV